MTTKPTNSSTKKPNVREIVSLKELCTELKMDRREARDRLRIAVRDQKKHPELSKSHQPGATWEWVKGSPAEQEARELLKSR